jgi:manganese transport protein
MKRLLSVLFWSVLAAAFIGPGTVTTAAAAGTAHGYGLLWALGFSVVATLVLLEAAARLTIASGRNLAEAIRGRFRGGRSGLPVLLLVLGAVVVGNAAYAAGNLLGAVAGVGLAPGALGGIPGWVATLVFGAGAGLLLWHGAPRQVALLLSLTVALMAVAFLATAFLLAPPPGALLQGLLFPTLPAGSALLVLGLVGTTVVPYNLFLGSGLARGRELGETRFGLGVAVILGGVVSMGILVVGAAVPPPFSFEALGEALATTLGPWAAGLLALGLAAAGFSSATTAPLAAAVTALGLFGEGESGAWGPRGVGYRAVWGGILAVGILFALSGVRPVPAILVAQALNGVLLPFAALFLLVAVNDARILPRHALNGVASNTLMTAVTFVTVVLGSSAVIRAVWAAVGAGTPREGVILTLGCLAAVVLAVPVGRAIRRGRAG